MTGDLAAAGLPIDALRRCHPEPMRYASLVLKKALPGFPVGERHQIAGGSFVFLKYPCNTNRRQVRTYPFA